MADLPTGTVTFLYTDIEGSTRLWERHPAAMRAAVARHDGLLRHAIAANQGHVFRTMGDGLCAAFATAPGAVAAALDAQRALHAETWGETPLGVRLALHVGAVEQQDGDYVGACLNRIARLLAVGHGGQTLLSQTTADLARENLPADASLHDLGEHRLRDLLWPEHVFQLLHPALPANFPALRSLDRLPNNLPRQLTSFIGRERELAEVTHLLATTVLLTLTGTGGCGKTRLALQVAAELVDGYPDGVWLVELAPLADPSLVPRTVAAALGVSELPSQPILSTLISALRAKHLLLVLDNCEHLIDTCAHLAEALLRTCPGVRVLATSRELLGAAGETAWRVPSLTTPDPQNPPPPDRLPGYEAVQLFAERARLVQPAFAVTAKNATALIQICHRLDGISLALELAAARVTALSVEQIAARLDDRFRLLTGGRRTALRRQQTLLAAIDWSYALLTEGERAVLRRLAVFAGGWTLEAAEAICVGDGIATWAVLDLLTRLVEKSLVVGEEQGGAARYWLLETIRQYARDRLVETDEAAAIQDRHARWCLALAEQAEPALFGGPDQPAWMARLEIEHDNLRAALAWCQGSDPAAGLALAGRLWHFWRVRGHVSEGRRWLDDLLAADTTSSPGRAAALRGAAALASEFRESTRAIAHLEEGLAVSREVGTTRLIASMLRELGGALLQLGDRPSARARLEEGLALARVAGDQRGVGAVLGLLGQLAEMDGDIRVALHLYREATAVLRIVGDGWLLSRQMILLGNALVLAGEAVEGQAILEESLAVAEALDAPTPIAMVRWYLGRAAAWQGEPAAAADHFAATLAWARATQSDDGVAWALVGLGRAVGLGGDPARATVLLEEGLALYTARGDQRGQADALEGLGRVARWAGDEQRAAEHCRASLRQRAPLDDRLGIVQCLEMLAGLAITSGQPARAEPAVRLLGQTDRLREVMGCPRPLSDRANQDAAVAAARVGLGAKVFAAAWAAGQALPLERAVAEALADEETAPT